MRFVLILLSLLLPQVLLAQFNSLEPGSYVLITSPTVRHQSLIKLRGNDQVVVKDEKGKKCKLTPLEVASFRIGQRKYTTAGGFEVNPGLFGNLVERAFVELLDSGNVSLLRYEYTTGGGAPMMGAGGMMMGGGGSSTRTLYLLRWAGRGADSPIPANGLTGAGRKFREALLPHLSARPDLAKLVAENRVDIDNLPAIVRALNSGQSYVSSSSIGSQD